jgi:hypothetical protein
MVMNPSQIPEKELFASVNKDSKIQKKETVYFFERSDGQIIATSQREAWTLYTRRQQVIGSAPVTFKLVGTGSGDIFYKALLEAQSQSDVEVAKAIIKKGQEDEYNACKGNIIPPPNFDKFGDGARFI